MDPAVFDFFYGGATDESTLRENEEAFKRIKLYPKVLRGVEDPETSVSFCNQTLGTPILVAPMAFQRLCHPRGELETIEGAGRARSGVIISTYSTTPLEEIVINSTYRPWFQLYFLKDRGVTRDIIQYAEDKGCSALVLTVDAPVYGKRERELKNPLQMNIDVPDLQRIIKQSFPKLELINSKQLSSFLSNTLCWEDIAWICSISKLPIFLKGVLREDDALKAVKLGVNGIVVSNHGGRQLDTTPATISVLPQIAQAVGDQIDILIDGGIRRGTDIFKALALGAKAVLLGRPVIWALAAEGSIGVCRLLSTLTEELKLTMTLCGCKTVQDIIEDFIFEER